MTSETLAGTGKHGADDGPLPRAQFFEPGGLAVLGDKIYVADTNNHQIRVLDLSKKEVHTLELKGLEKLARQTMKRFRGRTVDIPKQQLEEGESVIHLNVKLPAGYKLNSKAPMQIDWKSADEKIVSFPVSAEGSKKEIFFPLEIPLKTAAGHTQLTVTAVIYYCAENSAVCLFDHVRLQIPVEVSAAGASALPLDVAVQAV